MVSSVGQRAREHAKHVCVQWQCRHKGQNGSGGVACVKRAIVWEVKVGERGTK